MAADVVVSEFMASNSETLSDIDGDSSDWIELFNPSSSRVSLGGWYLTDDAHNLEKWRFPDSAIEAEGNLLVFASGKDRVDGPELHTNFRLDTQGEFLALVQPDGETIAHSFAPEYPVQQTDVSFGIPVGDPFTEPTMLLQPSPGEPNGPARLAQTVRFSYTHPTFTDAFTLTLSGATPTQTIVYTQDGTIPSFGSAVYTAPLTIDHTVQIRSRVMDGTRGLGVVKSQGYSRLSAGVAQFASRLPIILIENFGAGPIPNKGFPHQTGADTFQQPRQAATVSLFDAIPEMAATLDAEAQISSRSGIRVRGAFSATFDEPGYSLEFWGENSDDVDVSPLGMAPESDWVLYAPHPEYDRTLIDNTFLFSISTEMGHWAPDFQYVEAFINTDGDAVTMNDHVGLYVFEEKVKRSDDRIDFERFRPDGTAGGWMLTVNRMDAVPEDDVTAVPQNFHTAGPDGIRRTPPNASGVGDDIPRQYNAFINFEDPNGYRINAVQRSAIELWFEQMEDVLYGRTSAAWNDPIDGYPKYIDVDSFVDYFILNNLSRNGDGLLLSMWLYNPNPNGDGKLTMGPIWDADLQSFESDPASRLPARTDRLWYARMFQDPDFQQRHIDRWFELRRNILADGQLTDLVDRLRNSITEDAAARDGVVDWPNRLESMKSWLSRRTRHIDRLFIAPLRLEDVAGAVPAGFRLSLDRPGQTVYYTLDGTDPRRPGGVVSPTAFELKGDDLYLSTSATVTARVFHRGNWSAPSQASFTVREPGDVSRDGQVNADDIDLLLAAAAQPDRDLRFDLNSDQTVDHDDVTYLVESVLHTRVGDTNLDGKVNFDDFLHLAENIGNKSSWSGGNVDTNPLVDFSDFLLLADNFGFDRTTE